MNNVGAPVNSWVAQSSNALADWRRALNDYHETRARLGFPWMPDPAAPRFSVQYRQHQADALIERQRAAYRHRVLGAYRAFCLPLEPDEVVPYEVALLMYEQWDTDGCDAADAVNL